MTLFQRNREKYEEGRADVEVNVILANYIEIIKQIYGSNLEKIILFGSYARGDNKKESDIDIMILVNISDIEAKAFQKKLFNETYDFKRAEDLFGENFMRLNL